ncbi:hypothetical protein CEXT_288041 [Caerostris extrusa]|uniref:Uncharacterized protein n=1 Tax=Caerostris extrusa TaxID=172846 RepID=A0AAV4N3I4_CAEEX|nr:hypothetical protein CEXT_288041 [Caerostris extrusa]
MKDGWLLRQTNLLFISRLSNCCLFQCRKISGDNQWLLYFAAVNAVAAEENQLTEVVGVEETAFPLWR